MELHALTSPFLSYAFMNVRCKERRDVQAKWCEQLQFPGTAVFQMTERFCSSVLLLHLQHPLSPIRTEAFTVRNYHREWFPESINHTPISTLFFLPKPSFKLQHTCVLRLLANTWHGFSLQHQPGFSCTCWGGPQWFNCWACKSQRGLPLDPRGLLPEPGTAPGSETSQHVPIVGRPWKGYGYFIR